jgi:hypothetical protein
MSDFYAGQVHNTTLRNWPETLQMRQKRDFDAGKIHKFTLRNWLETLQMRPVRIDRARQPIIMGACFLVAPFAITFSAPPLLQAQQSDPEAGVRKIRQLSTRLTIAQILSTQLLIPALQLQRHPLRSFEQTLQR